MYHFWAKKDESHGLMTWLPLDQHLNDTAEVIRLLWNHWLSARQKTDIINSMSVSSENLITPSEDLALQTLIFLAATHDIGKATPAFQIMPGYGNSPDLDHMLLDQLEGDGFEDISHLCLRFPRKSPHALAGQSLLFWYGLSPYLASIIGAHHGKPSSLPIDQAANEQKAFRSNYYQVEREESPVYQAWKRAQEEIIQRALVKSNFKNLDALPTIWQPGQVLISGLLIMADWIASNTDYFPLISLEEDQVEDPQKRVEEGFSHWYRFYDQWTVEDYNDPIEIYKKRFAFDTVREVQKVFAETCEAIEEPGIIILEAPMGLGKTEAAFVGSEIFARKMGTSGLFFGLPSQATSNAMFDRYYDWLENIAEEKGENYHLRLSHGKAALNETYQAVARQVNMDGEKDSQSTGTLTVNEWFSGRKKSSLDDFVVGTVDQMLMLALKQNHLALRHLGFSRKVVVIDEVHAYDTYMSQYLDRALTWLGAYQVPVILLSATLPADRREDMIKAYLQGRGVRNREMKPFFGKMERDAYPLISYSDGKMIQQRVVEVSEAPKSVQLVKVNSEAYMQILDDLFPEGGIIGIIVNTVHRAQQIAHEIAEKYGADNVELLHSAFTGPDRAQKEKSVVSMIGKDGDRPKQKIIIGTQVLEQSLDIDFDVLLTDLAPMDLLIQRIGRLHRHAKHNPSRPSKLQQAICYILGSDKSLEFEMGTQAIYQPYILARTQLLLPKQLEIPNDISPLVQNVYSRDPIDVDDDLSKELDQLYNDYENYKMNKASKAKTFQINKPLLKLKDYKGDPVTLSSWQGELSVNYSEERAYAQVRDIEETVEVLALQKMSHGYGLIDSKEDLSGRVDQPAVARKIAEQTLVLPRALTAYSKKTEETIQYLKNFDKQYFKGWQELKWLHDSLGILFDEEGNFEWRDGCLHYDSKWGLTYERREEG